MEDSAVNAEFAEAVVDNKTMLPTHATIKRGRSVLDAVGMNLTRRELKDIAVNLPTEVRSAHIFADGSPIAGSELQGMIFQYILVTGIVTTLVMPGVTLAFGCTNLAAKLYAFLWSRFLLVGPELNVLQFWLARVSSLTTDMGTEIGMGLVADVLPAFLAYLNGAVVPSLHGLVRKGSRLFPRALRLPGWGHTFGNLMKFPVKSISQWPRILSMLRSLCLFFRVGMWRDAIVKAVRGRLLNAKALLKRFVASLKMAVRNAMRDFS